MAKKSSGGVYMAHMKSPEDDKYDKYAVECAAKTLLEAEGIKSDKKMMDLVKEHLGEKKRQINSISDLKAISSKMDSDEMPEPRDEEEEA